MRRVALVLALTSLMPGCYLAHERDGGASSVIDTGVASRSETGSVFDVGIDRGLDAGPARFDALVDAGPVLPADPDPDMGEDARPSDYADAGEWQDPPPLGPDDPCCTLGAAIEVTGLERGVVLQHRAPAIAWGPNVWGLLTIEQSQSEASPGLDHPVVFELSPDGTPIGERHALDGETDVAGPIVWAEGRWGVAVTDVDMEGMQRGWVARLLDAQLRPATSWIPVGSAGTQALALAYTTTGRTWQSLRSDRTTLGRSAFTEAMPSPIDSSIPGSPGAAIDAVGLRSRVAMIVTSGTESTYLMVLDAHGAPLATIDTSEHAISGSVTALRDLAIGVSAGDQAVATVIDPFALTTVAGAIPIGPSVGHTVGNTLIDVAGSSKLGVAGVCWVSSSDQDDGTGHQNATVDFRVIGPDGTLRGAAVRVIDGPFRGAQANCAVGTDEQGFLVAWLDGIALWVRRIALAD